MTFRTESANRTPKRIVAGIALAFVALTLAACGASTIDPKSVSKQIVASQKEATPDFKVDKGKCPDDIEAKKGAKFKCTVNVGGVKVKWNVNVTKIDGDKVVFDSEQAQTIISVAAAESFIAQQAEAEGISGATAECGDEEVIVQDPKSTFTCSLSLGSDSQDVVIEIKDLEGNVEIVQQ